MQDPDMKIVMSFQYGGKPIVLESAGLYSAANNGHAGS
jgi:hypothetical protein